MKCGEFQRMWWDIYFVVHMCELVRCYFESNLHVNCICGLLLDADGNNNDVGMNNKKKYKM